MSRKRLEPIGEVYGLLTVLHEVEPVGKTRKFMCRCECGSEPVVIALTSLRSGNTRSCGCLRNEVSGRKKKLPPPPPTPQHFEGNLRPRICHECKSEFMGGPRAWYCHSCRADRQRAAGAASKARERRGLTRQLGSTDICERCQEAYTIKSGKQRFCPKCRPINDAEMDRKLSLDYYGRNREEINPVRNERRRIKPEHKSF